MYKALSQLCKVSASNDDRSFTICTISRSHRECSNPLLSQGTLYLF